MTINELQDYIKEEQKKALEKLEQYKNTPDFYDFTYYKGYYAGYLTGLFNVNLQIVLNKNEVK